jgi:hypothetical protein
MRAATASVLAVLLMAAAMACRGVSPTTPTQDPQAPRVLTLTPGSYFLTLGQSTETVTTADGQTFSAFVCASSGQGAPSGARLLVELGPTRSGWEARATNGSLKLTFGMDQGSANGEMYGSAASADGNTRVDAGLTCYIPEGCPGGATQSASVSGTLAAADTVVGGVTGHLAFSANGASSSCSANTWKLARQ